MDGQMDGEINKQNIWLLTPFQHWAVTPFKLGLKFSPIPNGKKFPNFVLKNSRLHLHFQLIRDSITIKTSQKDKTLHFNDDNK